MRNQSRWSTERVDENTVWIVDVGHNSGKSVTNDAENVVQQILNLYGNRRIMYCDSDNRWDELLHDGNKFTGFGPGIEAYS